MVETVVYCKGRASQHQGGRSTSSTIFVHLTIFRYFQPLSRKSPLKSIKTSGQNHVCWTTKVNKNVMPQSCVLNHKYKKENEKCNLPALFNVYQSLCYGEMIDCLGWHVCIHTTTHARIMCAQQQRVITITYRGG